jgi:hypothetical protein
MTLSGYRPSPGRGRRLQWCIAGLFVALLLPARAQYPGHVDTQPPSTPSPRAVAVLEWTGQAGKPNASQIVPIVVFDGQTYQPGAFYLARPEPLSLEPGTEYVLQEAGLPTGLFDVNFAQDSSGYWLGYGVWRHPSVANKPKPHFAEGRSLPLANASAENASTDNARSGTTRPTLRRSSNSDGTISFAPPGPETPVGGADPDRPHLQYGVHDPSGASPIASGPVSARMGLQQMVGVSDAIDRRAHSFRYAAASSEEFLKLRAQMETLAKQALAPAPVPAENGLHGGQGSRPSQKSRVHPAKTLSIPVTNSLPAISLTGEEFMAYTLAQGSGPTLVFSAQSLSDAGEVRYITLVVQPDFYGHLHVIFESITDDKNLDAQPRMRLVDAVDTRGDGQGELLFELLSRHDRQFALFAVDAGKMQQLFATGPLRKTVGSPG